ncbi:MAG: hypothetical protein P8012_08630 [Desulfobacterales bacterium]
METDNVNEVAAYIRTRGYCRIGVDGIDGVGKSTLAAVLASTLGMRHLNLDDYLVKKQGGFLSHLKYDELQHDISEPDRFVVEGVCLLAVLEQISTPLDCLVYVKRMCHHVWADERECDLEDDVEDFLDKEKKTVDLIEQAESSLDTLGLAEELIRYHDKYRPHKKAECFYAREYC